MRRRSNSGTRNEVAAFIFILLFIIGYIVSAYMTLDEETRHVPLLASYATLFFLVMEICNRTFLRNFISTIPTESSTQSENGSETSLLREAKVILSVFGLIAGIYTVGFFMGIFLYIVFAIAYLGAQSFRLAILIAFLANVVIYLVFERALEYQLFPGILFP